MKELWAFIELGRREIDHDTKERARKFIMERGANHVNDLVEFNLIGEFIYCVRFKKIQDQKCREFFENLSKKVGKPVSDSGSRPQD